MKELFNGNYAYKGYHQCDCVCHLEIRQGQFRTLVIATEIADNEGTSITNCAEKIASMIAMQYHINPMSLTWVEHYGPMSYREGERKDEYQRVTFQWDKKKASHPEWSPMPKEQLDRLKGVLHEEQPTFSNDEFHGIEPGFHGVDEECDSANGHVA